MNRKSPTESATLYKIGTKKKGNDGNIWITIELSNGVKRWKLFKKSANTISNTTNNTTIKPKITKLGFLFINFIEDESLFPNSPKDVANLNKELAKLWKILKENDIIETVPKTKYVEETYYMKDIIYLVNVIFELANKPKYFHEPAKLTEKGRELLIKELKNMKFIE
jgi:hypothetical protein